MRSKITNSALQNRQICHSYLRILSFEVVLLIIPYARRKFNGKHNEIMYDIRVIYKADHRSYDRVKTHMIGQN